MTIQWCRYLNGTTDDDLFEEAEDVECDVLLDMGHGGQQTVKFFVQKKKSVDVVFVDHPCFHRNGNPYGDTKGTFKDNTFRYTPYIFSALSTVKIPNITATGSLRI